MSSNLSEDHTSEQLPRSVSRGRLNLLDTTATAQARAAGIHSTLARFDYYGDRSQHAGKEPFAATQLTFYAEPYLRRACLQLEGPE